MTKHMTRHREIVKELYNLHTHIEHLNEQMRRQRVEILRMHQWAVDFHKWVIDNLNNGLPLKDTQSYIKTIRPPELMVPTV